MAVKAKINACGPGVLNVTPQPPIEFPSKLHAALIPGLKVSPLPVPPGVFFPITGAIKLPKVVAIVSPKTYTKPLKFASNNEPKIAIVGIIIGDNNVKNLI